MGELLEELEPVGVCQRFGNCCKLTGGALFGPLWGSVWNLTGATLGATLAFLVARYVAGDWVARRAGGLLKRLIDGVDAEGWRFVAFVRLVPPPGAWLGTAFAAVTGGHG